MRYVYILLILLIVASVLGCTGKKASSEFSTLTVGETLPESYVAEIEGNLTEMESTLNESEADFSLDVDDSAFD